jgi:hypothetical protein
MTSIARPKAVGRDSEEVQVVFYWIYDIPPHQLALLIAGTFVAFSWTGCIIIRPLLRRFVRAHSETNAIVNNVLSCHGVFYGLLLGLLAVAAYQNFSQAQTSVSDEAAALSALYEDFHGYPEPERSYLRWLLRNYCRNLIKYAWPVQRQGVIPSSGRPRIIALQERLLAFNPQTKGEEIAHAEANHQFNIYLQIRQRRLDAVTTGIPTVMWYVVIIGALINMGIVWLLNMKFIAHLFLGGILAFFLGTMIFLIATLDHPFRGEVSITPEPIEAVYAQMMDDSY